MYTIDKDFVWDRMNDHFKRVDAAHKAWVTRHQNLIAKRNAGVPPTMGRNINGDFVGFHAPHDGYIHSWVVGGEWYTKEYMGGQFLPIDKWTESMCDSLGTIEETRFTYVPVEKFYEVEAALREVQERVPMATEHGRPIYISIDKGQTFADRDGTQVCYAYLSKAPKDVIEHVEQALLGEVRDAEQKAQEIKKLAEEERQRQYDAAPAIEEGRQSFVGEVLTTKWQDSFYGPVYKMLVQDDRGFKLWGTCPNAIDPSRGDRVAFVATATPSDDDPKFGFFKRPAKAVVLDAEEAVA